MALCRSCRAALPDRARFCPACGTPTDRAAASAEERKVVSVLFADLVGSTARADRADPEDVRAALNPFYARLRAELERFGGTVEKFVGDAVMALFGAPVAHEDDPERAVRAALAIGEAVARLNEERGLDLRVRVAVATGEAVVELAARPSEGESMAAGDVLNTGFRLAEVAPANGILVDEPTYRATQDAIEYEESPVVFLKGKAEPLLVWRAVDTRARFAEDDVQGARAPLVGRREELALLVDALERVRRERAPRLVTLVGVPGIGKSRLVSDLGVELDARPELVYWRLGRSLPYGEETALWALADIVRAHAGILRTDGPEATEEKLRRAIPPALVEGGEAEWAASHLRPLVGLALPDELRGDRRSEAFAAWRRFLEGIAEQRPLVLVFEDLHWADDGLLDFVDYLASWASTVPLLVLCTARPELLERRPGWGGGKANAAAVALAPLTDAETAQLLAAHLEDAAVPPGVESALLAHAEGNPLYAEEYARMLVDRGYVRRHGDEARVDVPGKLPLPESLQGVVAARIDTLSTDEKSLLQDAAVVGRVFWLGAVATMNETPRYLVEERLNGLERKEFVRRKRRTAVGGELQCSFRHVLVREVAYGQIPRAARSDKHRVVAEWLESLTSGREDLADVVAHHYHCALGFARAAGRDDEALAERTRLALREAGDRAAALNAHAGAARFFRLALDLWPSDDGARAELLFCAGKALFHAGDAAAEEVLVDAGAALVGAEDVERAAEVDVLLAELQWRQGRRDGAFERLAHARELVDAAPSSRAKAYVLSSLSRFHMVDGAEEDAIRTGFEALQMAEELGLDELRAHALNNIGVARSTIGDRGGLVDLEQSLAIALRLNSPESVRTYLNLGSTHAAFGDLRRAYELYEDGRRAADRFGDATGIGWFAVERVFEHYWSGRWDDAVALVDELMAPVEPATDLRELACRLVRGWIRLARGDGAGARDDAEKGLAFARALQFPQALYPALAFAARVELAEGARDRAAELAGELLAAWAEGLELSWFWTADLALVLAALGRGRDLAETASRKAATPWLDAARALATGDAARAAHLYAEIGAAPEEAHARLRHGEALLAKGASAEARAELERARGFFARVGAAAYDGAAEALLAGLEPVTAREG